MKIPHLHIVHFCTGSVHFWTVGILGSCNSHAKNCETRDTNCSLLDMVFVLEHSMFIFGHSCFSALAILMPCKIRAMRNTECEVYISEHALFISVHVSRVSWHGTCYKPLHVLCRITGDLRHRLCYSICLALQDPYHETRNI